MRLIPALLAMIAIMASLPAQAQAPELGRLFFTPEQRAALDARRKARIPDKPTAVVVESPVTRLDGLVSRGGGRSSVGRSRQAMIVDSTPTGAAPPSTIRSMRPRRSAMTCAAVVGET